MRQDVLTHAVSGIRGRSFQTDCFGADSDRNGWFSGRLCLCGARCAPERGERYEHDRDKIFTALVGAGDFDPESVDGGS